MFARPLSGETNGSLVEEGPVRLWWLFSNIWMNLWNLKDSKINGIDSVQMFYSGGCCLLQLYLFHEIERDNEDKQKAVCFEKMKNQL